MKDMVSIVDIRPLCKICGSHNIIRYGNYRGIQRWWCKDCRRKFADNAALPDMKKPTNQVGTAVGMYYEGRSLSTIPRIMCQLQYDIVTSTSVSNWITRFSEIAINEANKDEVDVGDVWITCDKSIKICGKNYWIIDIIDSETWFLLGTILSSGRSIIDIKSLLDMARNKAGKIPKQVLAGKWIGYKESIERAYGSGVQCNWDMLYRDSVDYSKSIESWQRSAKDRYAIIHRLKNKERVRLILGGWLVHYNYFRIHRMLYGKTPAEAAKTKFKYSSWVDLIHQYWSETGIIKIRIPPTLVNTPISLLFKNSENDEEYKIKMMQRGKSFSNETQYTSGEIHHAFRLVPLHLDETDIYRRVGVSDTILSD
jgi:transposase-like protein